jgi:hypothetical protein
MSSLEIEDPIDKEIGTIFKGDRANKYYIIKSNNSAHLMIKINY